MSNHSVSNKIELPLFQEKHSVDQMNETVNFLTKMNKLNESSMNINVKSRFNLIQKEKERLASIENKEKTVYRSSKKDRISFELTALFNRFKEMKDESFSVDDYETNRFFPSNKRFPLFNNKSIKDVVLKKVFSN
jgi:hypothetical protein